MINIKPLQGARRLDRAADSAVLYGTLRETMEINSHYKSRIVLSPLTEIDDQMGTDSLLFDRPDANRIFVLILYFILWGQKLFSDLVIHNKLLNIGTTII